MGQISDADLVEATEALLLREPRFQSVITLHGLPPLRLVAPGLESLLRIVTDQLISLKAGEAIWRRISTQFKTVDPDTILSCGEEGLRQLGLTRNKALTFLALAKATQQGLFEQLHALDDDGVTAKLTTIHGIGPWTADIYLLTALGRVDAWPARDLALQAAAHDLLALAQRPSPMQMHRLAEAWQPWRSVAARLLWSHYRGMKGLKQTMT